MTLASPPRVRKPRPCVRCGTGERTIDPEDGLPTFVCAPCSFDARAEVRMLEALFPGNRSLQRLAAMRDLGWAGGWR